MPKIRNKATCTAHCTPNERVFSPYFSDQNVNKEQSLKVIPVKKKANMLATQLTDIPGHKKTFEFYDQECFHLAKALLGKLTVIDIS